MQSGVLVEGYYDVSHERQGQFSMRAAISIVLVLGCVLIIGLAVIGRRRAKVHSEQLHRRKRRPGKLHRRPGYLAARDDED